jgi:drug/metabolite transporter (DMT)-like permease
MSAAPSPASAPVAPPGGDVGVLMVAGAAALWGTWSWFLRPTGLPGAVTGPVVFALMGVVLLPAAWRTPRPRWDRAALALLAANAALDAVNVLAFFEALGRTTVAVATMTHYLAPVLIAVAAPWIERERVPGAPGWALVATGGLVLVLEPWRAHGPIAVGAALGATSAVCYAGTVFVVRRLAPRIGAERSVAYHALLAAALLAPIGALRAPALHVTAIDAARLGAGALLLGAVAGALFVRGLARIGSARAAVLTFAEPVVAVAVGRLVWGEELGLSAVVGAAMIVAAGAGVSRARGAGAAG